MVYDVHNKKTLQHQGECTMATRNCQVCLPIKIEKSIDPDDEVAFLHNKDEISYVNVFID